MTSVEWFLASLIVIAAVAILGYAARLVLYALGDDEVLRERLKQVTR